MTIFGRRAARAVLITWMVGVRGLASAQTVPVSTNGVVSLTGTEPVYTGNYVLKQTDLGLFWLDTSTSGTGHIQALSHCGVGQPPTNTNLYVVGDCNSITDISSADNRVLVRALSGQCGAQTIGCGGARDDGHSLFLFRLGTWEYLGDATDPFLLAGNPFPPTGQVMDPQCRTWTMMPTDTSERNFIWQATAGSSCTADAGPSGSDAAVDAGVDATRDGGANAVANGGGCAVGGNHDHVMLLLLLTAGNLRRRFRSRTRRDRCHHGDRTDLG
jgi:hypothetical protein